MKSRFFFALTAPLLLSLPLARSAEVDPATRKGVPIGSPVGNFSLKDTNGKPHELGKMKDAKAVALIFMGTECPMNNSYMPRLSQMAQSYAAKGVIFLGINSNSQDTFDEVSAHAREYHLSFPVCKDFGNKVADLAGARRTPEVVVLDAEKKIRYRGRIDDQFGYMKGGQGYQRPKALKNELAEAVDSVLAGKAVATPETEVTGCLIGREVSAASKVTVTYADHIAPLIQKNCTLCHRPGQIGPMSLETFEQVKGWGHMIQEVVQERRMPPWHADPAHGTFRNNRSLSDAEVDTIVRWVDSGMPRGESSKEPKALTFEDGWIIGKPDVVFKMKEPYTVPAEGTIRYQYFTLDADITKDLWVKAVEVRPGNRSVVHHILMFVLPPGTRRVTEDQESGFFGAYAPGNNPMTFAEGTGKKIAKGSKIVFQMHYTANGVEQSDQSYVGLILSDKPLEREVHTLGVANPGLYLPAGAEDVKIESAHRLSQDVKLLALMPHTHLRGKAFRYEVKYPDGKSEVILNVPRYDFNWQTSYLLEEPKLLPKGTIIHCEAHYDNSANNPNNPDATRNVRWGPQTWDEMMIGYFDYIPMEGRPERLGGEDGQARRKEALERFFKQLDKNADGKIVKEEVPAAQQQIFLRLLDRFDENNDGAITLAEVQKALR